MQIQFLGAAREVTGSKHLITTEKGKKILLDCGMFQGKGQETDADNRNLGFDPREIDCVILSHAHIDHSGLIPYIYKKGFRGSVICTPATRDLCALLFVDTAYIQQLDNKWYNKKMDRQQKPHVEPLYDIKQAEECMRLFITVDYDRKFRIDDDIQIRFTNSGHMLGSAVTTLYIKDEGQVKTIAYTGDVGREHSHLLQQPQPFPQCDILITESTYGDRMHEERLVSEEELLKVVQDTCVKKQGKLIIPSFSVGRTQEIVFCLNNLYNEGKIPHIPVYVDSPLSVNATNVFRMYTSILNEEVQDVMRTDPDPFGFNTLKYVSDIRDSKALNRDTRPGIIISASGMLEAGRVKHHVANHIDDPSTTILFVGYCSPNTLGAKLQKPGIDIVSIFGFDHRLRAGISKIEGFSGHGDYSELIRYYMSHQDLQKIRKVFIVHGEAGAQDTMKEHMYDAGFRSVECPEKGETFLV